jgi:two-component system NtrC family sensor kinase
MSIRTALLGLLLALGTVTTGLVGVLGVWGISHRVRQEAQERVNVDLATFAALHDERRQQLADRIGTIASGLDLDAGELQARIQEARARHKLSVLNVCAVDGTPLAGTYSDDAGPVPMNADPVLRAALAGKMGSGTVLLDRDRLVLEGGVALAERVRVIATGNGSRPPVTDALFWWAAAPVTDAAGRVRALVYGGRALNLNFALVDELRERVFGAELYEGKPRGTVTIFLGGTRVATNVIGADRRRAVNTLVSDEVKRRVLGEGQPWYDRAWVVDAWYLSAYQPLTDPDGRRIGMLYVGLLEAPYEVERAELIRALVLRMGLVGLVALVIAVWFVNRITRPLKDLTEASSNLARGDHEQRVRARSSYREIDRLASKFRQMQDAIAERDQQMREQNAKLATANERLSQVNRNYMESLGFVTHELKSPLAAIQSMVAVVQQGYVGPLSEQAQDFLNRIARGCEELQDMVKNYLDLSRAERGELTPQPVPTNIHDEVVARCVADAQPLFAARQMTVDVACPDDCVLDIDAELMRIALTNYLNNAAKYGNEGTVARLMGRVEGPEFIITVRNEGEGFTATEREALFKRFSRLKNTNTSSKRGSGLGLFLTKQIAEAHGGRVWAEAEPGRWAMFGLALPRSATTDS